MALFLLRHGRFLNFAHMCEFLQDEVNEALELASVLHGLWCDGLVSTRDRFRYEIEAADGHVYKRLEIWVHDNVTPDRGKFGLPTGNWGLFLVLKTSSHIQDSSEFDALVKQLSENGAYKKPIQKVRGGGVSPPLSLFGGPSGPTPPKRS